MSRMLRTAIVGFCMIALAESSLAQELKGRQFFEGVMTAARHAVQTEDLRAVNRLTAPSTNQSPPLTKEVLHDMKDMFLESYPDLRSAKILRFQESTNAALFVVNTWTNDPNWITLDVFQFISTPDGWKIAEGLQGTSFARDKDEQVNKARIEKELNTYPAFTLEGKKTKTDGAIEQ
jgi:hypothetical protein